MFGWLKKYRRRQWLSQPVSAAWLGYLERGIHQWHRLSATEKSRLCDCVRIFIAETYWEGCDGLAITDEVRVTIAGNAALMLLGAGDYYFDGVRTVVVFPDSFARKVHDGMLVTENVHHSGEAYRGGTIVLSWADVQDARRNHGRNVVIHEFAHHIDGLDGAMEGTPPLSDARDLQQWRVVAKREFDQLVRQARLGSWTLIDQYGADERRRVFCGGERMLFRTARRPAAATRRVI